MVKNNFTSFLISIYSLVIFIMFTYVVREFPTDDTSFLKDLAISFLDFFKTLYSLFCYCFSTFTFLKLINLSYFVCFFKLVNTFNLGLIYTVVDYVFFFPSRINLFLSCISFFLCYLIDFLDNLIFLILGLVMKNTDAYYHFENLLITNNNYNETKSKILIKNLIEIRNYYYIVFFTESWNVFFRYFFFLTEFFFINFLKISSYNFCLQNFNFLYGAFLYIRPEGLTLFIAGGYIYLRNFSFIQIIDTCLQRFTRARFITHEKEKNLKKIFDPSTRRGSFYIFLFSCVAYYLAYIEFKKALERDLLTLIVDTVLWKQFIKTREEILCLFLEKAKIFLELLLKTEKKEEEIRGTREIKGMKEGPKNKLTPNLFLYYPTSTAISSVFIRFMGILSLFLLVLIFISINLDLSLNVVVDFLFIVFLWSFFYHIYYAFDHNIRAEERKDINELKFNIKNFFNIIYYLLLYLIKTIVNYIYMRYEQRNAPIKEEINVNYKNRGGNKKNK